ncbi:MAG: helix-turn-helix transcriptional regulator [bacterium]|nr:helix-turn-helix transcriptional regulator [bacterium]
MLLQIICQAGQISGYKINKVVEERQYRIWAGIGTTSIYTGLEKLRKKRLVTSCLDVAKRGKGPLPTKFWLTKRGQAALKKEIEHALSSTRERDLRFDLALAAIPLLSRRETASALRRRKRFLCGVAEHVNARFETLGGEALPLNIKALFKHSMHLIKHELDFVDILVVELQNTRNRKESRAWTYANHGTPNRKR